MKGMQDMVQAALMQMLANMNINPEVLKAQINNALQQVNTFDARLTSIDNKLDLLLKKVSLVQIDDANEKAQIAEVGNQVLALHSGN